MQHLDNEDLYNRVFWDNVSWLLDERDMSIYDLSSKIGLSERSLLRCKERNTIPKGYRLLKISRTLKTPIELLFVNRTIWNKEGTRENLLLKIYTLPSSKLEAIATLLG